MDSPSSNLFPTNNDSPAREKLLTLRLALLRLHAVAFEFPDRLSRYLEVPMSESVDVSLNNVAVTHNEKAHRFELYINGLRALLAYRLTPGCIVLLHTEVPQPLEGQGLAAKL